MKFSTTGKEKGNKYEADILTLRYTIFFNNQNSVVQQMFLHNIN